MLDFNRVSFRYSATQPHWLLKDFSHQFTDAITLISGANGSGKTTLLLLAAGLLAAADGEIRYNNVAVDDISAKPQIGISAAKVVLLPFFTAAELLNFHCNMFNCALDEKWLEHFGLTPFLHTKVSDLSLGNAKKLSLITAIVHQPTLLLLDEPFNGLDEHSRAALSELLQQFTGQILIASHEPLTISGREITHLPVNALIR